MPFSRCSYHPVNVPAARKQRALLPVECPIPMWLGAKSIPRTWAFKVALNTFTGVSMLSWVPPTGGFVGLSLAR